MAAQLEENLVLSLLEDALKMPATVFSSSQKKQLLKWYYQLTPDSAKVIFILSCFCFVSFAHQFLSETTRTSRQDYLWMKRKTKAMNGNSVTSTKRSPSLVLFKEIWRSKTWQSRALTMNSPQFVPSSPRETMFTSLSISPYLTRKPRYCHTAVYE